jgi:hypothetical protein
MSQVFRDFACWDVARVGAVINKEATEVSQAVFLATHAPFRRIGYELSPRAMKDTDEDGFLEELVERTRADQHTFAIVKGIPGTGKSHLIRWLKERYEIQHPDDKVILLTRARTSLKGALEQILEAGVFEDGEEPREFQRLRSAVATIASTTLDDKLIDAIRNAAIESGEESFESFDGLPKLLKESESVYEFLNDGSVRRHLKREGGAVQRVLAFLSEGSANNAGVDDFPGFEDEDLDFPTETLRAMGGGYELAKKVAHGLVKDEEDRENAIKYFNHLLRSYAIQSATNLTAQDLKALFLQVRRYLKAQGRRLALFIEDITSLTGIENGLLEVLITQHTGDPSLCQITSVVGTTDEYYGYFQRNITDRMTHRLSLNAESGGRAESDFTKDAQARAELVARYLNAIRHANNDDLERWRSAGAVPSQLPNACAGCPFRQPCHQTFGSVELSMGEDEPIEVGLYPFNRKSLDTLYNALREDASKTPRGLLDKIISYILISHTSGISNGEFPPPRKDICPHVELRAPFNPPTHERLVDNQAGEKAGRVKTLLLVWGDGHVSPNADGTMLGGIPRAMLDVFRLPQLQGAEDAIIATPVAPTSAMPTPSKTATATVSAVQPNTRAEEWNKRISEWWLGGKLRRNEDYEDRIADLFRYYIDFQAHNISLEAVKRLLVGGRLPIEGRSSNVKNKYYYELKKNEQLRDFLYALGTLVNNTASSPSEWGDAVTTVTLWLKQHEAHVIRFLLDPETVNDPERYADSYTLPMLLTYNVMLSACLSGKLAFDEQEGLYESLMAAAFDYESWNPYADDAFPEAWQKLRQRLKEVSKNRKAMREMLNRPQGVGSGEDVRFLNTPLVLAIMQDLEETGWQMPPLPHDFSSFKDPGWVWGDAYDLAKQLNEAFADVVEHTMQEVMSLSEQLQEMMGDYTPQDTVAAVGDALKALRPVVGQYPDLLNGFLPVKGTHRVEDLQHLLEGVQRIRSLEALPQKARFLSRYGSEMLKNLKKYLEYFNAFQQYVQRSGVLGASLSDSMNDSIGLKNKIRGAYSKLKSTLSEYSGGK